jgi:voltage-gated potassium channel
MSNPTHRALLNNLLLAAGVLAAVHVVGTVGFLVFDTSRGGHASAFDAFYMTFITVATIGYGEIFDMSANPPARLLTIALAMTGIASLWVIFSNLTALLLARTMDPARARVRLLREIGTMRDHYIICGLGRIGAGVARELLATRHAFVAIETSQETIDRWQALGDQDLGHVLHADASDDATLTAAGIENAKGVFAVTGEDGRNVLITLSARHLNPNLRVVARVHDVRNIEKCRRAGADEIVSPDFTGALRIASAMLRPHASGFVDVLLNHAEAMRMVDITVPKGFSARPLGDLQLRGNEYLVVGMRTCADEAGWQLNPGPETLLSPGAVLIAMATPEGAQSLRRLVNT